MDIIFFQKIGMEARAKILIVFSLFGKDRDTRKNFESDFNARQAEKRI